MMELLLFVPGLIVTLIGFVYVWRMQTPGSDFGQRDDGTINRASGLARFLNSPFRVSFYFTSIFLAPFLGAYGLAYLLIPSFLEILVTSSTFGLVLSIIAGVMSGLKLWLRLGTEDAN